MRGKPDYTETEIDAATIAGETVRTGGEMVDEDDTYEVVSIVEWEGQGGSGTELVLENETTLEQFTYTKGDLSDGVESGDVEIVNE